MIPWRSLKFLRARTVRILRRYGRAAGTNLLLMMAILSLVFLQKTASWSQQPTSCPLPAGPHSLYTSVSSDDNQSLSGDVAKLKLALREYWCFQYDPTVVKVLGEARNWVETRAGQVANPALVLDIDETALSNWEQIFHSDADFISDVACKPSSSRSCNSLDWTLSATSPPIRSTVELFSAAKAKHVAIFFITGRPDNPLERAATVLNLRKAGFDGWDGLIMRPSSSLVLSNASYRAAERVKIEMQGFTIIANVGDQISDLAGGHAERSFRVPNPLYFVP